ncbi:MAG: DUF2911 domain-containing protein [Bacteroidota bacterium]
MKKFLTLALLVFAAFGLQAQDGGEEMKFPGVDKSVMDMAYYPQRAAFRAFAKTEEEKAAAQPVMRVVYSRPMKNGRTVFGELLKYGEMWRAGANESTELMLMKDVKVGGKTLEAGRYTIYVIPQEDEWEVHFSTDTDGWGHYAFKPEASSVASITVPTAATPSTVEAFAIMFQKSDDGAHMIMAWDTTMARVPFTF